MIPGFAGDAGSMGLMAGITIGKVVDIHPEQNSVDVRCATDARKLVSVPVVGLGCSGNTGIVDLPVPDLTTARSEPVKWNSFHREYGDRDILAVIAFADGTPICLGFVLPPHTQMTFEKPLGEERRIYRHASDQYDWTDRDANSQWCHPNGSYVTVSEDPEKLDLTEKDFDKFWRIKRNLTRVVHFVLSLWNGAEHKEKARVHIAPDGSVTVRTDGNVSIQSDGNVAISAAGNVAINADTVDINGEVRINEVVQVGN